MNKEETIKSDTLSIIITNRIHANLNSKARALKISKCCKIIRDRTKDHVLYDACRRVISATSKGAYDDVIKAITLTEFNYSLAYHYE